MHLFEEKMGKGTKDITSRFFCPITPSDFSSSMTKNVQLAQFFTEHPSLNELEKLRDKVTFFCQRKFVDVRPPASKAKNKCLKQDVSQGSMETLYQTCKRILASMK